MTHVQLQLELLPGRYAVCRLESDGEIPEWACSIGGSSQTARAKLLSITRTDRELSIVLDQSHVPAGVKSQRDFIAWRIVGTLEFSMVGILAKLTAALAGCKVPVFVISTFDTDVLLVQEQFGHQAVKALRGVATVAAPHEAS